MWLLGCLGLPRPSEAEAYDGFGIHGLCASVHGEAGRERACASGVTPWRVAGWRCGLRSVVVRALDCTGPPVSA